MSVYNNARHFVEGLNPLASSDLHYVCVSATGDS
jgi:hypothetical protein